MREFWDERYGKDEYAYGTTPNQFFKEQLAKLRPGKILLPGDGEGRNSVWAAQQGWQVTAFDQSEEGRAKAMKLAEKYGVEDEIDFEVCSLEEFEANQRFDVIASIFFHIPAPLRRYMHDQLRNWLARPGIFILEAFTPQQVINKRESGGPPTIDMMNAGNELREELDFLEIQVCEELVTELSEGPFHHGLADVVRFVGMKT